MRILHICLASFYIDNYSYQENLLPKHHKLMGNEVEIIASLQSFDKNGKLTLLKERSSYLNENGILVHRLNYIKIPFAQKIRKYKGLWGKIEKFNPHIIFVHGCQFTDLLTVGKYVKKHTHTKLFIDNHADQTNSARNVFSKIVLHGIIYKWLVKRVEKYTTRFWGVMPSRVDFLRKVYKLPTNKIDLLIMGGDDEVIDTVCKKNIGQLRKDIELETNNFVIITGGKIDKAKKQIFHLMESVNDILNDNVKLIIFGSVQVDLKEEFYRRFNPKKMIYLSWASEERAYELFRLSDLAIFPGRHSVYWEQCVAVGIPMIVKEWPGTKHIDIGGNVVFLKNSSKDEISSILIQLINKKDNFHLMKRSYENGLNKEFLYSRIASRSICQNPKL